MTTRSPEHNPHERADDRELGAINARLDDLERRTDASEEWQRKRDAADLAAARQLVADARKSLADVTGQNAAIVLDERKTSRGRRWDVAKIAIQLAISTLAGAVASQWHHLKDWLGIAPKGH